MAADLLRTYSTSALCDAFLRLRLRPPERVVPSGLSRLLGQGVVAGRARTVQFALVRDRERAALVADRELHFEMVDGASRGDVLVLAAPAGPPYAIFGGILALKAAERGVAGVVVDGATRDLDEIAGLGLPLWGKSVTPIPAGYGGYSVRAVNVPVTCGGVEIQPGDHVVGDSDGLIIVPADDAEQVVAECANVERAERLTREAVARGEPLADAYPTRDYYREKSL